MKRPNTCTNLIRAIKAIAAGTDEVRLSRSLANVIVGQMLPDGVVKGGSSLMFRYGAAFTRYTRDVDTARVMEHDEYIAKLIETSSSATRCRPSDTSSWGRFESMCAKRLLRDIRTCPGLQKHCRLI